MLNSHLDVVPAGEGWTRNPLDPTLAEGRVYGRGSADAKGSLAAMAVALVRIKDGGGPDSGEIVYTAVADEEVGSRGTRALLGEHRPQAAIIGEPTSLRLMTAHKGSVRPVLEVVGIPAHAATPHRGHNAIQGMADLVGRITAYATEISGREHALLGSPTVTPVLISGGEAPNAVPERCRVTLDRRLIPGETSEDALAEIDQILAQFNADHAPLRAHLAECAPTTGGPSEMDPDHPFVVACGEALDSVGQSKVLAGLVVNCDMTHFRAAGVPCLVYGPGELEVMHAIDESVPISQLERAVEGYAAIVSHLLSSESTWAI